MAKPSSSACTAQDVTEADRQAWKKGLKEFAAAALALEAVAKKTGLAFVPHVSTIFKRKPVRSRRK